MKRIYQPLNHITQMKLPPSQALNRPLYRNSNESAYLTDEVNTIRRLGFRIGNLGLLIAEQATSELSEVLAICPIPFSKNWLLGLMNLREIGRAHV